MLKARFLNAVSELRAEVWDGLFGGSNPFIRHAFLKALEDSGSVSRETGWQPHHLVLEDGGRAVAVMPLYLKSHSYGEFVFDWTWAHAYQRRGLAYYPKWVTAVPFTPSAGPRIGIAGGLDGSVLVGVLLERLWERAAAARVSGWHLLFPDRDTQALLGGAGSAGNGLLSREDVQFHWHNRGYENFNDFLAALRSARRKTLRRERQRVAAQGVTLTRAVGGDIGDLDWEGFYRCYVNTYLKRSGHGGYLNRTFFDLLRRRLADQLMLVTARGAGDIVACALFLHDRHALYGRYWGALADIPCLHFEACFYQGIEFCIERGLDVFDPGTQGEHKLLRGFEPVTTRSWHWIADPEFRVAIADFLDREMRSTAAYSEHARRFLPFRRA